MSQLALFETPDAPIAPATDASSLRARVLACMGSARFENFSWWCKNGCNDMCAAVLWRFHGFNQADAKKIVQALRGAA